MFHGGRFATDHFQHAVASKIRPAIMWGLAGLAIWMAAWFVGKRLDRKWTLYALSLAPFGLVLWACFVNVDQALPSY